MRYLYYKIYQDFKRIKTNDTPALNAMIVLTLFEGMNLLTVQCLINHYFKIKIDMNSKDQIMIFSTILYLLVLLINYLLLYKKREEICLKYNNESKLKSRVGFTILILYCISSAILVYVIGSKYPL